jgi:hypothetical protein
VDRFVADAPRNDDQVFFHTPTHNKKTSEARAFFADLTA